MTSENILTLLLGILWGLNPIVAFGATVGSLIVVNSIDVQPAFKKYLYTVLSGVIGYFVALPFHYTDYAFLIALLCSSLAISIILAAQRMISHDRGLPIWVDETIKAFTAFINAVRGKR